MDMVLLPYEFTLLSNCMDVIFGGLSFYYLMNLHYSQTIYIAAQSMDMVLLPYEFTLLSNFSHSDNTRVMVLLPYEFTLLSNDIGDRISGFFGFTTL